MKNREIPSRMLAIAKSFHKFFTPTINGIAVSAYVLFNMVIQ